MADQRLILQPVGELADGAEVLRLSSVVLEANVHAHGEHSTHVLFHGRPDLYRRSFRRDR